MTKIIELRPNKSLVNPDFEKYQFSGDTSTVVLEKNLEKGVLRVEPSSSQESWLETRLFAFHNHLVKNPFDDTCWFVDEDRSIWRLRRNATLDRVHTLSNFNVTPSSCKYNPSVAFASDKIAAASNGHKNLEILIEHAAGELKSFIFDDIEPGIVLDARYVKEKSTITIAMCGIIESNGKKCSQVVLLSYLRESEDNSSEIVKFNRKQRLTVKGAVEYVYIEKNNRYLQIVSQDSVIFDNDPSNFTAQEETNSKDDSQIKIPKYCWSQDEDTLNVWMKVSADGDKSRIKVDVTPTSISIAFDNSTLIQGESGHRLDAQLTTWSLEEDSLKIDLIKTESGLMWNELIKGDTGGECLPNETLAAEIHSKLAHLCTKQPEREGQAVLGFNTEQLEECDIQGRDNLLQRIDVSTRKTTHLAMLGASNRVLFTHKLKSGQALCVRHDHNGCVWLPGESENDEWDLNHVTTFPGFGYVEASKANKKFCISPPDGSYAAIVEHTRHVFLYEKPETSTRVGKQQIIDLGSKSSPIMGVAALDGYLVLLSRDKLYQLQIQS